MINPPSIVNGQSMTTDLLRRMSAAIRACRIIEGYGLKAESGPDGTRVSLRDVPSQPSAVSALRFPAPWDMLLRQTSAEAQAGVTFVRRWASLGGVFRDVSLILPEGNIDSYTPLPAVTDEGSWIVAVRIQITADALPGASVVYYPATPEGLTALADACKDLLDSYILPLYMLHFTPDPGKWSVETDLRGTPSLVVYA